MSALAIVGYVVKSRNTGAYIASRASSVGGWWTLRRREAERFETRSAARRSIRNWADDCGATPSESADVCVLRLVRRVVEPPPPPLLKPADFRDSLKKMIAEYERDGLILPKVTVTNVRASANRIEALISIPGHIAAEIDPEELERLMVRP